MKNKKADWTFGHIIGFILLLALLLFVIFWYGGLREEMINLINSFFG